MHSPNVGFKRPSILSKLLQTPAKGQNEEHTHRQTWKMSFPSTALRRYRARSMIMVLNWMSSITRKASGTWSSDSVEAMSAAAVCF